MLTDKVHVCLEQPDAPRDGVEFEPDARWICACGDNYVFHDGFNRAGHQEMSWYQAPPLPAPRRRMRDLLIRPRQGS